MARGSGGYAGVLHATDAGQQDTGIRRRPVSHTVSVLASAGVAVRITYTWATASGSRSRSRTCPLVWVSDRGYDILPYLSAAQRQLIYSDSASESRLTL